MRTAKVTVDMSSEQKNLMGVASTRQAIYLLIGGSTIYAYIVPTFQLLIPIFGIVVTAIISLILAAPVVAIVVYFGFLKIEKYNMYRDTYFLIWLQRKTQYGNYRKGD